MVVNATYVCRSIDLDDYESLIRFFAENNMSEITRYFHPFPFTPETAQFIACQLHQDKYYVAVLGDQIVGLSMLRGWDEGFSIPSFGVVIDYRYHGQGIGRKLLEYTISDARQLHCQRVRLTVYASNAGAVHLYKSVGFYEDSRIPVIIGDEADEKIIMFKDFCEDPTGVA